MAAGTLEERFADRVAAVGNALAHADRQEPFSAYCRGLILPGQRESVGPMAARVHPEQVSAAHQSLHHLVAKAAWSDDALLAAVRERVPPALGPVTARCASRDARARGDGAPASCWCWLVDDPGFPKKGRHSVGVARQ